MNETEEQHQNRLKEARERGRSTRMNETEEQRQSRLEEARERSRSSRTNETEEQRESRLEEERERSRSSRTNETEEQRESRLEEARERSRSTRMSETEEQRQNRLDDTRERNRSTRINESEEQRQNRLEQQRKLSKTNRLRKRSEKQSYENTGIDRNSIESRLSISQSWPEPIARELKETRLQQFLEQMSMSILAEVTCAVCNVRTPEKDSKTMPVLRIPNIHLLKVSEELKGLIKYLNEGTTISATNNTETIEHAGSNI